MGFVGDNIRGKRGENLVINILQSADIECKINDDKKTNLYYDIESKIGNKKFKIEVKSDYMAQKTGNLAIEYHNSKKDAKSGIEATQADIWTHCVQDMDNLTVWMTHVEKLKHFINTEIPLKIINKGGDGNAELLIYQEFHILSIFERMDNLEANDIKKTIRRVLKYEKQ